VTADQFLLPSGLLVTGLSWLRPARWDARLLGIYAAAMLGASTGAKLIHLAAEGWLHLVRTCRVGGRSSPQETILGALLGGYVAVELAKRLLQFRGTTGDLFAPTPQSEL